MKEKEQTIHLYDQMQRAFLATNTGGAGTYKYTRPASTLAPGDQVFSGTAGEFPTLINSAAIIPYVEAGDNSAYNVAANRYIYYVTGYDERFIETITLSDNGDLYLKVVNEAFDQFTYVNVVCVLKK
jgi:hypothetical protein